MWSSYSKWVWVSKHRRRCWLQLPQVHRTRRRCRTGIVACACRAARQFPIRRSWHNWGNVKINENHVWWCKNLNWCWYMLIQFECLHLICHGKKVESSPIMLDAQMHERAWTNRKPARICVRRVIASPTEQRLSASFSWASALKMWSTIKNAVSLQAQRLSAWNLHETRTNCQAGFWFDS